MGGYEIVLTFKPGLADPEQVDRLQSMNNWMP